jgi:hypothetical protein
LKDVVTLVALAAWCAALLRKSLFGNGAMLGYDLYTYFFPAKVYAAEALRRGELPLWNPYVFAGVPFLANVQMAVLYPPDLLFAVLEFHRALAVSQWLHLTGAGAGMYALCRWGWGLDRPGALIGAVVFAGGGFFGAHMGHLNQVHASTWLPWLALCLVRLAAASGRLVVPRPAGERGLGLRGSAVAPAVRWLVAGGLVVALQLTAGHTQEVYYTHFGLGLLALGYTVFPPARAPRRWSHLPAYGAIAVNGAVLSAAQLLPALELSRLSYRQGGVPLEEAVGHAVERTNLLESLLPTFWSLPSQEVTGYIGAAAVPLVLAALAGSPARRTTLGLTALALLAITLSLGTYTPLYAVLYHWVPLFDSFRAPGRWLLISSFALAGLAAHGATALREGRAARFRESLAFGFGLALLGVSAGLAFVAWRTNDVRALQWLPHARVVVLWALAALGATALGWLSLFWPSAAPARLGWTPRVVLAGVLALELTFAAREMEYNRPGEAELYQRPPSLVTYLEAGQAAGGARTATQAGPAAGGEPGARVLSLAVEQRLDPERLRQAAPREDGEYRHYAAMREALKPNLGMVYRLPTIDGYDGGLLPTQDYARFKSLLVTTETPVPHYTLAPQMGGQADAQLLGALNVRYLLSDGRHGPPGPGWILRADSPGAAWLYENPEVKPRAYLAAEAVPQPAQPEAAVAVLAQLDLSWQAMVDGPAAGPAMHGTAAVSPGWEGGGGLTRGARIVRYSAQEVEIETEADEASLLVVTDGFYPGWRATVDGAPSPVLRTNVLFRGVVVPAGTHRVRLWFDPLSVKLGFIVSGVALLANALALGLIARPSGWRRGAERQGR